MTWINFLTWLAIFYGAYYGLLILWDQMLVRRKPGETASHELSFVEDTGPVTLVSELTELAGSGGSSSVLSSGGQRLKDIFRLAQEEAIEYIRPVSF